MKVNSLWHSVQQEIVTCFGILLLFSPKTFLLCWFVGVECVSKLSNKYVLTDLITAASMLLAQVWKMDSILSLNYLVFGRLARGLRAPGSNLENNGLLIQTIYSP